MTEKSEEKERGEEESGEEEKANGGHTRSTENARNSTYVSNENQVFLQNHHSVI